MGAGQSKFWAPCDETPQREVTIGREFAIGKYEVTREEYARFASLRWRDGHEGEFDGPLARIPVEVEF